MHYEDSRVALPQAEPVYTLGANLLLRGSFLWMFIGLALTTAVSVAVATSESLFLVLYSNPWTLWGLLIAEVLLVIVISAAIGRLSAGAAAFLFLLYSAINGATLSSVFLVYAEASIIQAFVAASCLFAAMAIFGYFTRLDLTSWGVLLMVGLATLFVSMVVNMFIGSSTFEYFISVAGIVVFLGLTAYDTQKILRIGAVLGAGDPDARRRTAIIGALTLYLDFVNLLLFLLRLFGRSRD
ncbi:MAG: Bax inhibitor-1/YccA family protein [Planctomycetota bacterium]|jgi:FtsH-binding integral membrane protein|nr:Bax inhibitor-1/YccA family protein [Planctomycetota bacterium]